MLKKITHRSCKGNMFLPKRSVLRNLNFSNEEREHVEAAKTDESVDLSAAKKRLEQTMLQSTQIDSRLTSVQLSHEAREKLNEKARKLRFVLEERGQELDAKLHQDLQNHLRELESAVAKGKIHANVIEDLKKTEAASREMQQLNARKWAQRIDSGSHILGAVAAAPVNAAVTASVSIIRGVIRAFKNK